MSKINVYILHLLTITTYFVDIRSNCTKESVPLDTKLKVPNDDIEKIVKFRKGTTFKIKDSINKRIGEVTHGSIMIMKDIGENIEERVVYLKSLKRSSEKYIIKIITKRDGVPYTEEFIIEDSHGNKTCTTVMRDAIDVNIRNVDDSCVKTTYSQSYWYEYSIRNELNTQYRIGNILDGETPVVRDHGDLNVRMRFFHVSEPGLIESLLSRCIPFLAPSKPTLIRVFTYYYMGERSFDEYVESRQGGKRSYVELVRESFDLNLARRNSKHFKKYKIDSETFVHSISDEYKNNKKIGKVMNNNILIVDDSTDVRLRSVYTYVYDKYFEHVEVKSCYKKGDCRRCKYILEDNKYSETVCKMDKDGTQDVGSSSRVFESKEQLETRVTKKANTYTTDVVSFEDKGESPNQIVVDITDGEPREFTIDVMPQTGAKYYSLNKEYTGKDLYLRISEDNELITTIHLYKTNEVNFIVKSEGNGKKRVFVWVKCGLELYKGHDFVIIDTLSQAVDYKSRMLPKNNREFIRTMVN
ncbi:hypothetical protein MACK_001765 [Theileria orientalis]|uniref:Uncharacterized protein n=1 Tax=Theileria orientalis TaxID=68886 RepID=A0A976MAF5_THEOR|nr:hypothetical protein MACK_001765 [Theileria orientalis]